MEQNDLTEIKLRIVVETASTLFKQIDLLRKEITILNTNLRLAREVGDIHYRNLNEARSRIEFLENAALENALQTR